MPITLVKCGVLSPFNLSLESRAVATSIAAFSFTSLAALTAVGSVLLLLAERPSFQRYKKKGYLSVFLSAYWLTGLLLLINCFLALANHSPITSASLFLSMLSIFGINAVQIGVIFFILYMQIARSMKPDN